MMSPLRQVQRDFAKKQQQYEARLALEQLTDFLDAKLIALAARGEQLEPLQNSAAVLVDSDVLRAQESLDEVLGNR